MYKAVRDAPDINDWLVITFKDRKREPLTVLVWGIQRKAQILEKVRAKFAIDHLQQPTLAT